MSGYLQRLVDATPGILPPASEPVVRSQSPIAQSDQRLALDPLADTLGGVSADLAPAPGSDEPIAPVARAAAHLTPAATPASQMPPPVAVQRFQAPATVAAAPPPTAANFAPAMPSAAPGPATAPPEAAPALQAVAPRQEPAPQISPLTIINEIANTAASPPENRAGLRPPAASAKSDEPRVRATPAPSPESTKPAPPEKPPGHGPDELAYVSPAERVFEALQQLPRPAPPRGIDPTIAAPDRAPATPASFPPAKGIPAREMHETIREIVREVVSMAPAPPREAPRMPKTAAEASVIGPLGSPYAAARRLALMLR